MRADWKPIHLAPRDGRRLLLYVPPYGAMSGHYSSKYDGDGKWSCHSCLNKDAQPTFFEYLPGSPDAS